MLYERENESRSTVEVKLGWPQKGARKALTAATAVQFAGFKVQHTYGATEEQLMTEEEKTARPKEQQMAIQIDAHQGTGVYSNLMMISHRKEEFILDFLFLQPQRSQQGQPVATLRSRVITSPEHAKRVLRALQENIQRYENAYGTIEEATDMPKMVH